MLAFWVGYAAAELKPLYLRLRELILASGKIAVDETVAPVLDPGRGRTKKGYFWAIARDDRPWGGTDPPAVAYTYAPGRGAVHGLKLLDGYRGIVQCDGYAAYKTIADNAPGEAITLAFCWAHLRRQLLRHRQGRSMRRSPAKRSNASPRSMRSRRRSEAAAPMSAARCARTRASHSCWRSRSGSNSSSPASPRKSDDRRRHPLRLEPLGRAHPLPRRRPHRARHQHRRAKHPSDCAQSQKRTLRRPRSRGRRTGPASPR